MFEYFFWHNSLTPSPPPPPPLPQGVFSPETRIFLLSGSSSSKFISNKICNVSENAIIFFFFQALIDDIILQINPADELSKLVYKICQMQDSNQNDELTKGLHNLSSRWNSLNLKVINNSNRSVFICFFKFISNTKHSVSSHFKHCTEKGVNDG